MDTLVINVARDFSRYPAGRFRDDGPFSGAVFREQFLEPAIATNRRVIVELDGVRGYGSSFLEEAFGGLIRSGVSVDTVKSLLLLRSSDPSLVEEIQDYLDHAEDPDRDA